jgi:formate hydrogenlyase subunit 3/multisubunit Na+/H+ antiporter MnhD subunit
VAGGLTALVGVVLALCQKDTKRLLAYHTISQVGYVVTAWGFALQSGVKTPQGQLLLAAALVHALYHSWFKGILFLTLGRVIDATGERDVYKLRSLGSRMPSIFLFYLVGAFSIIALPPFSGSVSKLLLGQVMENTGQELMLTLAGVGTVASFIKLSLIFFPLKFGAQFGEKHLVVKEKWGTLLALGLLSLGALGGGVFGGLFWSFLASLGGYEIPPLELYSLKTLVKNLGTLGAGTALFLILKLQLFQNLTKKILYRPRSFEGLFTALGLGTLGLGLWLLF